jgi:putative acetyltransferase
MVILISGVSCVGKTLMAQKLLEKYKIPYLSIDHIKMGIYRSNPECGFTPESKEEIITIKLWPIIKGIIMTNIENNQNIIIEGCYFPENINNMDYKYLQKIIFFYMGFSEKYIKNNFIENINGKNNIIENREENFLETEEFINHYIIENKINKEKCIKNNIKYFEIDMDYLSEMDKIYKWIDEEIENNGLRTHFV